MLIQNNFFSILANVSISIIRLALITISKVKSLLPLNLPRLNKNYLFALIDSHIITPIAGVSLVSLILLIFFSPIYNIMWLVLSSVCFFYLKSYKSIYKVWLITISIWYLIFTTTLAEIPILIGFNHTKIVFIYLIQNDVLFVNLCFQMVVILDILSNKLGFTIYIPAFINIIKFIIKFFKPKSPTGCSEDEDKGSSQQKSEKQSSFGGFSFWKPSPT